MSLRASFRNSARVIFKRPIRLLLKFPLIFQFILRRDLRSEYSIGPCYRVRIVSRVLANTKRLPTLSSGLEHLEMVSEIFRIPPSIVGDVIECGCYLGGSSANLSLACSRVNRQLVICDSFQGLPEPSEYDRRHFSVFDQHTDIYEKGRFAASLEDVKSNIDRRGKLAVCEFEVGFFEDTLQHLDRQYVLAFLDVDLVDSLKPCLLAIWPRLQDGCRVYVHEARSLSFVSLFFDSTWWRENLGEDAPGLVGAGAGLPLEAIFGSDLGYAQKGAPGAPEIAGE